jgi:hypothetical protein
MFQKLLNEKLDCRLYASPDVTMVIKSMGHVAHMGKQENFARRYHDKQNVARGIMENYFDVEIEIHFLGIATCDQFCIPCHVVQVN